MRTIITAAGTIVIALPLLAGALLVEIGNPLANPEALAKHAVLVARTGACHAPEKTSLTATAEGAIDGQRRTIPLKLIPLAAPGTFGVAHQWPSTGTWAVKIVARNPEYQNYVTGALIRFEGNSAEWSSEKRYAHEPTGEEVAAMLHTESGATDASSRYATLH